ncbi:MAG: ABC transporter ATP-binding protein [Alphaproteobacteria bacterium]|uniref:ABC transporter ATP-binding protein n=1 Tax=Candidatus Nitrobium versatile TaxID=2884831 RepID=A0A953J7S5_9BACT|nr:ABC transporter ATP-binding protein [Candidatus Nitrobium versatile]
MDNTIAIRVEGLGKEYHIGKKQDSYRTLRETIVDSFKSPLLKAAHLLRGRASAVDGLNEKFWALQDVSFEIKRGEVVGIIGRNGAGKSTLLKVLSRIVEPTKGCAEIRGRVGSLLEVGTGFHPQLTGRENIYLNGAILGMRRTEIERKFDEIVSFAEVEKFIDTPVKHYSSGMYLRLAFAVAAHLEPEILIVDEVLAVGDTNFQKKCLNKMHDVGQHGRTVFLVSHNMRAITRLCKRAILLEAGMVVRDGPADKVVNSYLNPRNSTNVERVWPDPAYAPAGDVVRLRAVRVRGGDGLVREVLDIRKPIGIEMEFEVLRQGYVLVPHFNIDNEEGVSLFTTIDNDPAWRNRPRPAGIYTSIAWIPGNLLSEGMLFVEAAMLTLNPRSTQFTASDAVSFRVMDSFEGDSARGDWTGSMSGVIRPLLKWSTTVHSGGEENGMRESI